MYSFFISALPFIIIGLALALLFANKSIIKKDNNYMTEGMCIGMCLGVSLSTSFDVDMGIGIGCGMFFGEVIGLLIEKKSSKKDK